MHFYNQILFTSFHFEPEMELNGGLETNALIKSFATQTEIYLDLNVLSIQCTLT